MQPQYPTQPGQYPQYSGSYQGRPVIQSTPQYPGQTTQYSGQLGQYQGQPTQYSAQLGQSTPLPTNYPIQQSPFPAQGIPYQTRPAQYQPQPIQQVSQPGIQQPFQQQTAPKQDDWNTTADTQGMYGVNVATDVVTMERGPQKIAVESRGYNDQSE